MNAAQHRNEKPKAGILASLTFSSSVRPKKPGHDARSPAQVLSDAIDQQLDIIAAEMAGGKPYTVKKTRFVKGPNGTSKQEVIVQPRSWYWKDASGQYFLTAPYGTKPIEFAPGCTSVAAGHDLASVRATFGKLLEAVKTGELDYAILRAADAAKKARTGAAQ